MRASGPAVEAPLPACWDSPTGAGLDRSAADEDAELDATVGLAAELGLVPRLPSLARLVGARLRRTVADGLDLVPYWRGHPIQVAQGAPQNKVNMFWFDDESFNA